MRPHDYDINLEYGPGVELRFVIDPSQLDCAPCEYPDFIECRFDTLEEARDVALMAVQLVGHGVEIEATAFWGWHGREVVDRIMVEPRKDN